MKKFVLLTLILAMVLSMVGCGCKHQWEDATCTAPKTCIKCGETEGDAAGHVSGDLVVSAVDTENHTMTQDLPCKICGEIIETKTSPTGIAPVNSVIPVSADEWYNCLMTNIQSYGAGQSLYSYPVESDDNALLYSVVSMYQMNAVFSFQDVTGNMISRDQKDVRSLVHNIRMDAQFTNDNAKEFFMLLMLVLLNNNTSLEPADANTLAGQIMQVEQVSDNGYTYAMEIISAQDHMVCVSINAE